jgi:hypothetical protein
MKSASSVMRSTRWRDRLVELRKRFENRNGRCSGVSQLDWCTPVAPDSEHRQQLQADQKMFEDANTRNVQEDRRARLVIIKRVLDDLRNIARQIPLERFPVDLNRTVADAAEAMEQHAETI